MPPVESQASPKISTLSWGRMAVEGVGEAKDFKLWPGGGRAWDWNETGTRHEPGIQPSDVQELLDRGSEVVVLGRGHDLALRAAPDTLDLLRQAGVTVHIEETAAAVDRYTELAQHAAM